LERTYSVNEQLQSMIVRDKAFPKYVHALL